ncbi:cytochrome c oxidase assembly factor 6 [Diutina catenulata]
MGFFSSSSETVTAPPKRGKRKECWDSRDEFFACLTANNIDDSLSPKSEDKVKSQCGAQRANFEGKCVESWVKYFQEKRFADLQRARYIEKLEAEGAQPLPFKLDNSKR